jgi:hypothetical protein
MGDTRGRGLCLLLSVILMGVPTVSPRLLLLLLICFSCLAGLKT